MNCSEIKALLVAYANNQLPPDQRQLVESHLENCINCRAALADIRVVGERLTSLRTMSDIPDIDELKLPAIIPVKVGKSFIRIRYALAAIPVAIIIIILAVLQPWVSSSGPQAVLAKSITATGDVKSFRASCYPSLIFDRLNGEDTIKANSELEFVFPDCIHFTFTIGGHVNEYIYINGLYYYLTDNNVTFAQPFPFPSVDDISNVPSKENTIKELKSITDLQQLSDEFFDGVSCYHFEGNDTMNKGTVIELWIGKDDYLLRQKIVRVQNDENNPRTTKYYDFNVPITIEAPLDSSGNLLPGWQVQTTSPTADSETSSTAGTTGVTTTITPP